MGELFQKYKNFGEIVNNKHWDIARTHRRRTRELKLKITQKKSCHAALYPCILRPKYGRMPLSYCEAYVDRRKSKRVSAKHFTGASIFASGLSRLMSPNF